MRNTIKNDSVNMVWHNDKFMQLNIVETIRYFVPNPMDHHSISFVTIQRK